MRFAALATLLALCGCHPPSAVDPTTSVRAARIADGVYAVIRPEPMSLGNQANSMFVIGDSVVLVVDAQFTRAATLQNLAALRRITSKPVKWVVNTHWHDDHLAGNQVYRDSFPAARFVSHANTRADLSTIGRANRDGQVKFAPPAADRIERLLTMGLGDDSTPASPAERVAMASAVRIIRQYVAEAPAFREILADTVVDRAMRIDLGRSVVELRWFGRGATRGDLVVVVPKERIIATGDLVASPYPFAFGAYPTEWIAVLDSIAALRPERIVPGHGGVLSPGEIGRVGSLLKFLRDSVSGAATAGSPLRSERRGWEAEFYERFFHGPVVARLVEERKGPLK